MVCVLISVPIGRQCALTGKSNTPTAPSPSLSLSHRDTQNYRVVDPNASLPRRSKSFKDQETQNAMAAVWHSKQLSTVTYVPPSPYQIAGKNPSLSLFPLSLTRLSTTMFWDSVAVFHLYSHIPLCKLPYGGSVQTAALSINDSLLQIFLIIEL